MSKSSQDYYDKCDRGVYPYDNLKGEYIVPQKIKIERDVPMPPRSRIPSLPFAEMKIGNSIVVEVREKRDLNALRQRMDRFQKKNYPTRLSLQTIQPGTVRVFRIEDYE